MPQNDELRQASKARQANLTSFSLERLIGMVARLGMDVAISCQPAQDGRQGHVTISLPQSA